MTCAATTDGIYGTDKDQHHLNDNLNGDGEQKCPFDVDRDEIGGNPVRQNPRS